MTQTTILLVDDDVALCELVKKFLIRNDFSVITEHNGSTAIETARNLRPDLVILDLMLPGTDGLSVCRLLREFFEGPVIMFTALDEEVDEVAGLETGADDYIKKPVSPRLLLAHVRALLRRSEERKEPSKRQKIVLGNLTVDAGRQEIVVDGRAVRMTSLEFSLLYALAARAGEIVSRPELFEALRSLEYDGLDRSVDLYISRIRRKLGDDPRDPQIIKTIRGAGYLCVNP